MPVPFAHYYVGQSLDWTGTNPDSMDGTGFGPVYYLENPGIVQEISPKILILWNDGFTESAFDPDAPELENVTPTPT